MDRLLRKLALFLLEGNRRPWWLTPAVFAVSLVALVWWAGVIPVRQPSSNPEYWLTPALFGPPALLTGWWMCLRRFERVYYKSVADTVSLAQCPKCSYSFAAGTPDRCPECGVNPEEFVRKARQLTQWRPPPPNCRRCGALLEGKPSDICDACQRAGSGG